MKVDMTQSATQSDGEIEETGETSPNKNPPLAISQPAQLLSAIIHMARDDSLDVEKLQTLLKMQQEMEIRAAEIEFNRALIRLSASMPQVKKNGRVSLGEGKGGYPFAKWEDMDKVIRPLMAEEGFAFSFDSKEIETGLTVTGTLLHKDGHSRSASMTLPFDFGPGRNDLQAKGSALAYGKRYCAEMLINIVREGDDNDGRGPKGFGTGETVRR